MTLEAIVYNSTDAGTDKPVQLGWRRMVGTKDILTIRYQHSLT